MTKLLSHHHEKMHIFFFDILKYSCLSISLLLNREYLFSTKYFVEHFSQFNVSYLSQKTFTGLCWIICFWIEQKGGRSSGNVSSPWGSKDRPTKASFSISPLSKGPRSSVKKWLRYESKSSKIFANSFISMITGKLLHSLMKLFKNLSVNYIVWIL